MWLAATAPPYPEPITTTSYELRMASTGREIRGKDDLWFVSGCEYDRSNTGAVDFVPGEPESAGDQ